MTIWQFLLQGLRFTVNMFIALAQVTCTIFGCLGFIACIRKRNRVGIIVSLYMIAILVGLHWAYI